MSLQLQQNNRWAVLDSDFCQKKVEPYRPKVGRSSSIKPKPKGAVFSAMDFPSLSTEPVDKSFTESFTVKMSDLFSEIQETETTEPTSGLVYTMNPTTHEIIRTGYMPPPPSPLSEYEQTQLNGQELIRRITLNQSQFRENYDENNMIGYGYENVYYPTPETSDEETDEDEFNNIDYYYDD
jgi:hypothetical protein